MFDNLNVLLVLLWLLLHREEGMSSLKLVFMNACFSDVVILRSKESIWTPNFNQRDYSCRCAKGFKNNSIQLQSGGASQVDYNGQLRIKFGTNVRAVQELFVRGIIIFVAYSLKKLEFVWCVCIQRRTRYTRASTISCMD